MPLSLLKQIREACKEVAARASYVHIDRSRIKYYAASLPLEECGFPQIDPRYHYFGYPEDTVAYILTLDTINFGSGYFPHLIKRPNLSGYFTIASSLKDRFEAHGAFTADELSRLSAEDSAAVFGQDPDGGPRSELMGLFASALNDLGCYLLERFDGRFVALVEAAGRSAERLVQILSEMPYFKDVQSYKGLEVPFYKRAQITAADLWMAFGGQGYGLFYDLDHLTIFADNLVPHVLRIDGILRYEDSLASRIDREELIPAGSPEEVEIRASALHAVELLVEELRKAGRDATSMKLDYLLWNRGQQPYYKAHPRHRTRTVFY
jgi:hypothetical protein